MKRFLCYFLILMFMLILSVSCSTRKPPSKVKDNGSTQSIPETEVPPKFQNQAQETPLPIKPELKLETPVVPKAQTVKPKPAEKVKPKRKPIAVYSTPLLNRDSERVNNIRLAIKKINNYKLEPGGTFSFNDVVGIRDAENGFKMAAVIIKGEYGEDMGGGVCQLSSTIFNAADKAGLEILERHDHTKQVKYVPQGRDAAVSYPYLDLKFKNTKDHRVKITASVSKNRVTVSIWKA